MTRGKYAPVDPVAFGSDQPCPGWADWTAWLAAERWTARELYELQMAHQAEVDAEPDGPPLVVAYKTEVGPVPYGWADNPRARLAAVYLGARLYAAGMIDNPAPAWQTPGRDVTGVDLDPADPRWALAQLTLAATLARIEGRTGSAARCRTELLNRDPVTRAKNRKQDWTGT